MPCGSERQAGAAFLNGAPWLQGERREDLASVSRISCAKTAEILAKGYDFNMDASEDTLQQIGQMLLRFAIGESFLPLHIRRQGRTWEILLAASIEEYKKKNDRLKRKLDCLDLFLEDPE